MKGKLHAHYHKIEKQGRPVPQVIFPGEHDMLETFGDLEQEVYRILVGFRCADFLPSYLEVG
jgi:hypothetical protein